MTDSEHTGFSMGTGQGKSAAARAVVEALTETWAPIPGAGYYEASDQAHDVYGIRSVDRTIGGTFYKGQPIKAKKTGTSSYWQVKIRNDDRKEWYLTVNAAVLLAHVGPCPPGMQSCHFDDNPDNNRLSNLRWDTPPANIEDRMRNRPRLPIPPRICPRCGAEHAGTGRRGGRRECRDCRVYLGVLAAEGLADKPDLIAVAERLDYPAGGLFGLAVRYGGLRVSIDAREVAHAPSPEWWLRRVINRARASMRNSDGA
jgi:hypothetical protein